MKIFKFRSDYLVITFAIVINLIIKIIADFHSGFHGDELLHIEAGNHLAFGYMDFSPIIAWLAGIQNLFHSESLFINHLFVYIASSLIILITGLITIELGGKIRALIITLSCLLFSPGLLASRGLFLPVIFEQTTWILCIYWVTKFQNSEASKYLYYFAISAAIGFLSKYSIAFLLAGIVISVSLFQTKLIRQKKLWIAVSFFLIIIIPNIIWQIKSGLPVIHHFSKLYETQLDKTSILNELKSMFLMLNPISAVVWISGLFIVPFCPKFKKQRVVLFSLLFTFLLLIIAKGKAYYFFPAILGVIPFGAVYIETQLLKRKWIVYSYISMLALTGIILMPKAVPVLPLSTYLKLYYPGKSDTDKIPLPFENYYSAEIWNKILTEVDSTYSKLPPKEKSNCLIWGRHYSQAGGINLMGRKYGLPPAFSFHSSFYNWVPDFPNDITVIVISDLSWDKDHWLQYFDDVELINNIENRFASDKEWSVQHLFLCRGLQYNSDELKQKFRDEIF